MKMSTPRLLALRTFATTGGRSPALARLFKRALVWLLITRRGAPRYVATSRYFSVDELDAR